VKEECARTGSENTTGKLNVYLSNRCKSIDVMELLCELLMYMHLITHYHVFTKEDGK
nr:hypothetical protein [Tanacetum cinerariifolium]